MSSIAILLIYRPTLSIKPRWWWFCDVLWTLVLARASFNTNTCAIVSTFHAIQASFCAQAASVKRRMYDQVGGQGNQGPSRHRKPRVVCFLFILAFFLISLWLLWLLWLRKKKSAASGAFEEQTASKVHCLAIHARLLQHGKMSNKAVPEQPWKKYVKERRWLLFQPQSETVQSLSHTHLHHAFLTCSVYFLIFKPFQALDLLQAAQKCKVNGMSSPQLI